MLGFQIMNNYVMFGPLPGFSAGSGSKQGPIGCLAATLAAGFMLLVLGGLLALIGSILAQKP